jgi:hypothetical protein
MLNIFFYRDVVSFVVIVGGHRLADHLRLVIDRGTAIDGANGTDPPIDQLQFVGHGNDGCFSTDGRRIDGQNQFVDYTI